MTLEDRGIASGHLAVVTGAADGIGLACSAWLLRQGMSVVLVDVDAEKLVWARAKLMEAHGASAKVFEAACDVSDADQLSQLGRRVESEYGRVSFLMNNAAIAVNPGKPWENRQGWGELLDINWAGVLNGVQIFAPSMIESGRPGVIVNTGSKQGITRPPGNAAYNVSKAAVLAYTEMLEHALRNVDGCRVSAHLLIPGFTYTGIVRAHVSEKPPGAWSPEQVADFLFEGLARGDFYILCPDNETDRSLDERRMAWTMGDIISNRPPLSRWHPDYEEQFEASLAKHD